MTRCNPSLFPLIYFFFFVFSFCFFLFVLSLSLLIWCFFFFFFFEMGSGKGCLLPWRAMRRRPARSWATTHGAKPSRP